VENVEKAKIERETLEEIDPLDDMHSTFVDLLIERERHYNRTGI